MKNLIRRCWLPALLPLFLYSCYGTRTSKGGGQTTVTLPRTTVADDIALPPGYSIEKVADSLNFPTAVTFDDAGNLYAIEAGYAYGEIFTEPRLLKIKDGRSTVIAKGNRNGPWTGITWHDGNFYIAEGGQLEGGKILRVSPDGNMHTLASGLAGLGDHHTNGPVVKDG